MSTPLHLDDGILPVLRTLCIAAGAEPGVPLTGEARAMARDAWGAAGPLRLQALARLLAEMRLARRSVFVYANPTCPCCRQRLTANERAFLALARAGLAGQRAAATGAALILTEGGPVEPTRDAALALGAAWTCAPR